MMRASSNFRHRLFSALARLDVRRPYWVIAAAIAISIVCVLYTRARLQFHTGQDDLISANNRGSRDYLRYTTEFPDLDGLIVAVEAASTPARAEHFADSLATRLHADHANVKTVFYRIDPGMMGNRALLYLSVNELQQLHQRVEQSLPMLRQYAARPTLDNLFGIVNTQIDWATAEAMAAQMAAASGNYGAGAGAIGSAPGTDATFENTPKANARPAQGMDMSLLDSILSGMLAGKDTNPPSPWNALAGKSEQNGVVRDGYLASDNGKYLLMYVAPGDGSANGPNPVAAIQASVDAVRAQFPGIIAGMTGGPALAHAEQTTTAHDMALATAIAIASNVLLLVIPFRGIVQPFFAIVALLTGVAWSFGFTTLAVGHLNLLSAVFASVLAGVGINFPIHLMARYDEARRRGLAMPQAVELAVVNTGTGVFASACIMALAFLMPMFTDFKGIAELGEISAVGLFLCLMSALLVFPSLVAIRDRNRPPVTATRLSLAPRRSSLEALFARPALIVGVSTAVTLGAIFLLREVTFNQNLLKLQASGVEAVEFENLLLKDSGRSSWFAVS
ncbi:MAG: MMPL family transporter, partial [Pseudomonadota bacterium]